MPTPYSYDMRQKAIAAVKRGERKTKVAQMFGISRNTLDLWLKREAQTGNCQANTNFQTGCRRIGGLCSRIGCGSGGMNFTTFVIVWMPHLDFVLTCSLRAITLFCHFPESTSTR